VHKKENIVICPCCINSEQKVCIVQDKEETGWFFSFEHFCEGIKKGLRLIESSQKIHFCLHVSWDFDLFN